MPRQSLNTINKRRVAGITGDRTDAIEQMNSKLKTKFNKIENNVNDLRAENLRYYHSIGKICEEIRNDADKYVGKDGTPGLKLIERALSTQARTLRKAAMFARTCDDAELEEFISLYNENTDFHLHWGHVSFLMTVEDKATRQQLANDAVVDMLDPPALHTHIKRETGRTGGHGRTHAMPKGVPAQIRQVVSVSKQWLGKNETVWNGETESVFGNILNLPPADVTQEMVDQLHEMEQQMHDIATAADGNTGTIERTRQHLEGILVARQEAEQEALSTSGRKRKRRSINVG